MLKITGNSRGAVTIDRLVHVLQVISFHIRARVAQWVR